MIIDHENLFSEKQAVTTGAQVSTNVIDLGPIDTATSPKTHSKQSAIFAHVTTAFAGGTSTSIGFQTDDDEAFGTAVTLYTTAAIALASLTAGYKFAVHFPIEGVKRYVRLLYTTVGIHTAGNVTAGLTHGVGVGPMGV